MTTSINHPWAISDKIRTRHGNIWADIDFTFEPKISAELFHDDPMNVSMGEIHIVNTVIPMRYKDLITYTKTIGVMVSNLYAERPAKTDTYEISVKGRSFMLNMSEIIRLYETLNESVNVSVKGYALGLYL